MVTQLGRVSEIVFDGRWYTLDELSAITGIQPISVAARLRDLRKAKFGGHKVFRRKRSLTSNINEYRVDPNPDFQFNPETYF